MSDGADSADDEGTTDAAPIEAAGNEEGGPSAPRRRPETPAEWFDWVRTTDHGAVVYLREILSTAGAVLFVALLLFGVSGLWPPMVAIESGSMEPQMERGDLVFVMEEHRLAPDTAYAETGVVTYRTGRESGYTKFNVAGDVIVFRPNGAREATPIIHRARFWVNESENWVANGKADPAYLAGADGCGEIAACPAPYAGFVTRGDNNDRYDQVAPQNSGVVRPAWVVGTAEFKIPWLGEIRLLAGSMTVAGSEGEVASEGRDVCGREPLVRGGERSTAAG